MANLRANRDNAKVAELRVWNITRTNDEIKAAMNHRLKGDEEGLIGYWQLNQSIDGKVKDLSPNDNNLKVHDVTFAEAPELDLKPFPKPKPKPKPVPPPAPPITDLSKKGQIDLISATSTDNFGFAAPAVGVLIKSEQSWYSQGVTAGQLLHSVALAPGESTNVAVTGLTTVDGSDRTSLNAIIDATVTDVSFDGSFIKEQIAASSRVSAMNFGRGDGGKKLAVQTNSQINAVVHQHASKTRSKIPVLREGVSKDDKSGSVVTNNNKEHAMSFLCSDKDF